MLLLHHTGAKSGNAYVNPLAYQANDGRYVVFASKGGAPTNPSWYYNLTANPDTTIEVGTDTIPVHAEEARGEEQTGSTGHRPSASRRSPNTSRRPIARSR